MEKILIHEEMQEIERSDLDEITTELDGEITNSDYLSNQTL